MDVNGVSTSSHTTATTNRDAYSSLNTGEFVKILISELQNQDPFEPQDSAAILEQLSSLRNIESQSSLTDSLADLVQQNQVAAAGNLIGKVVAGIDTLNTNTAGLVMAVRVTDDGVFLELDNGRAMDMSQVTDITELEAVAAPAE